MRSELNGRKIGATFLIATLLATVLIGFGAATTPVAAAEDPVMPLIVFDMSHGQYSEFVYGYEDTWLAGNLTEMGFEVVFAWGGINDTILEDATGLVIGAIYGTLNGFTAAEVTAIDTWFNAGEKFLWVGADSDFSGYQYINANASLVLEAVGSHVYPESISVSDPDSNAQASYRVISNGTSDAPFVADLVEGVDAVLMHGPTDLYGSTSATAGADAVRLENNTIENVYPVTYYGASATIGDSDLVPPEAHVDGESGEFVAMTVEVNAGTDGSGVIVVTGASPYGDYKPMYASEYYDVPLTGHLLVKQTIDWGMEYASGSLIVFDMSHGQYSEFVYGYEDVWLAGNLSDMGYNVVFAWGGLNDSILSRARGLVIGAIYGNLNGFTAAEVTAVEDWFAVGNKFLWVGADSDFGGYQYINANMSLILEACGSHVYPESISVSDAHSNAQASYRVISNGTTSEEFLGDVVDGVSDVLMHGPTALYGSTSATAGADAVRLENNTIDGVYPVLYYGASATIGDSDLVAPEAHVDGESGEFVAMTIELTDDDSVIVVSGASPYGDYKPMYASEYYDMPLTGHLLVKQTIEFGMDFTMEPFDPTATTTTGVTTTDTGTTATNTTDTETGPGDGFTIDPLILMVAVGAIVVIVIIVIVVKKR